MTETVKILAIDVSKDRLDCYAAASGEEFDVENSPAGRSELVRRCRKLATQAVVEATGGYERATVADLCDAGISVRLVDPRRVRLFARASGLWAKNDRLDARAIAAFASAVPGQERRSDPAQEVLAELMRYRRQLIAAQVSLANQARTLGDKELQRLTKRRIEMLKLQIIRIDVRIEQHISSAQGLAEKARILLSIPGVGPVLCAALLGQVPELGQLGRREIASLAGVAPRDNDSGKRRGPRSIYGGRPEIRTILYMAALTAARRNPGLAAFRDRLIKAGKKPKVAIVAVMRKLVVLANALLRDNRTFAPA